ncbi:unnamed protein product [Macrosiphum euphorbiae]|uniref:MULE transposase domain-containing protein n=1 Tax=Macrosiphum euphorbiae TaxID=13131 RepID=A0AAV0W307_9HEMI|nr:unnamed protein product [Macrosiphum euphorbiae]
MSNSLKRNALVDISCKPSKLIRSELKPPYFESAIHSAVAEVFPNAQIRGCRFHLWQSWWRKIQSLGLTKLYNEVQSETYIKFRSKSVTTKKMGEKEAFIREQMTKLQLKEIDNFELVKSLSFKFLPKQ